MNLLLCPPRFKYAISAGASVLISLIERNASQNHIEHAAATPTNPTVASSTTTTPTLRTPRSLEMRLAMNNDILGDEDLMSCKHEWEASENFKLTVRFVLDAPGPDLTSILGRDLSTYHRMSGRDIIMNQIINRKDSSSPSSRFTNQNGSRSDPQNSFCQQQNNSKMDTPILNRKLPRTWSSSGFVPKGEPRDGTACGSDINKLFNFLEEKALSDLERLARREKIYCMKLQNQNSDSDSSSKTIVPSKPNKL